MNRKGLTQTPGRAIEPDAWEQGCADGGGEIRIQRYRDQICQTLRVWRKTEEAIPPSTIVIL